MSTDGTSWLRLADYGLLMQDPEVRVHIARHSARSGKPVSAESILELHDQFAEAFGGVKLATMAKVLVPVFSKLGVKTAKIRNEFLPLPPGQVIVGTLCSLAARGRDVRNVRQAEDGCVIEATLPSDLWSWEGTLVVAITVRPHGVEVAATTLVRGQMFDWGKGTRCLNQLFDDLRRFPDEPPPLARAA